MENNNGRPWRFIGGTIHAPGINGQVTVWATASLDLDKQPLLVAAHSMADEYSVWEYPNGGQRFNPRFDDEISKTQDCAS